MSRAIHSFALGVAASFAVCVAVAAPAQELSREVEFNISPQSLSAAVIVFSEQSGIQVVTAGEDVSKLATPGVAGRYSIAGALGKLLKGTRLGFETVGESTVALVSSASRKTQVVEGQEIKVAQDAPDVNAQVAQEVEPLDEVIVTGTHIRGAGPVGSQVLTFDRREIDQQGYSTLPQFIQSLPQNFSGGISESTSGLSLQYGATRNFSEGSGINLRGLGNASTLVLLNGQRLAPSGVDGSFSDISLIPLSALERVEVLTDGASAIYGSDAIGGVVNFILRKNYEGAETRLRYGEATEGGLGETLVGQTLGTTFSRGYGLISYEYHHRAALEAKDRSFSANAPDRYLLLPEQDRHSAFLTGGYRLTDGLEIFSTGYYNRRSNERISSNSVLEPPESITGRTEQYGGTVGATVEMNSDWRAEFVSSVSRTKAARSIRELDDIASNPFTTTRAAANSSITVKVDGSLFAVPGGDAKMALGGNYRHDRLGSFGTSSSPIDTFSRNVYAAFAELHIPLIGEGNRMPGIARLELSAAGRYERYSDFGSSTDPKIGAVWAPVRGMELRGSFGTSFRAPLLTELDEGTNAAALFGSIPNNSAPGGTSTVIILNGSGNRALQAETATTWDIGLDVKPLAMPGFKGGVTYFNIDYRDRINSLSLTNFDFLNEPRFASVVSFGPPSSEFLQSISGYEQQNFTFFPGFGPPADFPDADAVFDTRIQNLSSTEIRGLDVSLSYGFATQQLGGFNLSLNGTYLFDFLEQISSAESAKNQVGQIEYPVNLRLNGAVAWSFEGFTTNLNVRYVDSYASTRSSPSQKVSSWTTADLIASYDTRQRSAGWLNDTTFTFGVMNLLDRKPPFVLPLLSDVNIFYDPSAASPDGRILSFQITRQW